MRRKLTGIVLAIFLLVVAVGQVPSSAVFATENTIGQKVEKEFTKEDLRSITRAEYCEEIFSLYQDLLELTTGEKPEEQLGLLQNPFTDTNDEYVLKLYALGIISGRGDGIFGPADELTLEEKAVMLCNTLKLIDPDFEKEIGRELDCEDEEQISSWAVDAIEYLYSHELIHVDEEGEINPKDNIRYEEALDLLDDVANHQLVEEEENAINYLVYGYDVIHKGPINPGDVPVRNPILDKKKLASTDYVQSGPFNGSNILDTVATTATEFYQEFNNDAKVSYNGILFSGSLEADYGKKSSKKTNQVLIKHIELHPVSQMYLNCKNSQLKGLLSDAFLEDVEELSPAELFESYGTHLIARYSVGGRLELNYNYNNESNMSESDIRVAVNASYKGASGSNDTRSKELAKTLVGNSKLQFRSVGGEGISGSSVDEINAKYDTWLTTLRDHPEICYVADFKNSMVPIWTLVPDKEKADALEKEFNTYIANANSMINEYDAFMPEPPPAPQEDFIIDIVVQADTNKAKALAKIPDGYKVVSLNTEIDSAKKSERVSKADTYVEGNKGAGEDTDFIYIGYLLGKDKSKAITDIVVAEGEDSKVSGYKKISVDFNKGAGSKTPFIYLFYTRESSYNIPVYNFKTGKLTFVTKDITPLKAISGYYGNQFSVPAGWNTLSRGMDLNKGAGGDYVYLITKR